MLQQDLDTHDDQDDAAGKLCLGLVFQAKNISDLDADNRERERNDADEGYGGNDADLQEGVGNADGERIDAGGDGEEEHCLEIDGVIRGLFLFGEGFLHHIGADQCKEHKGNPVVDGGDVALKARSEKIADRGH